MFRYIVQHFSLTTMTDFFRLLRLSTAALLLLSVKLVVVDSFVHRWSAPKNCIRLDRQISRLRDATIQDQETAPTKVLNLNALECLRNCASGTQARRILEKELGSVDVLYNSISIPPGASAKGISDGDLAIQTRLANKKYKIMELIELSGDRDADRASLGVLTVFVSSTVAAFAANQNLPGPEIVRFLVVWIFVFAPLAFVGYGIKDAEKLQTILVQVQRNSFPAYRKRMLQHEAGHFLMGHLLGLPIQGYTANAVKNAVSFYPLSDSDKGRERANQLGFDKPATRAQNDFDLWPLPSMPDVPYFSKEGRGGDLVETRSVFRNAKNYTDNPFLKLASENEPTNAWPFRGFADGTIDQLTLISLAGVCAEILAFGNAEGGLADLGQLRQIFNSAEEDMTERDMNNRIRYALGFTMSILRRHLGVLDALAHVMERDGSVAECIVAIETCDNVSGQDGMPGDYELRRREAFRKEGFSVVERVFLGNERSIDAVEDRLIEGKGGGSLKKTFRLTGDDPFYIALAVAGAFLAWASAGGLSLH